MSSPAQLVLCRVGKEERLENQKCVYTWWMLQYNRQLFLASTRGRFLRQAEQTFWEMSTRVHLARESNAMAAFTMWRHGHISANLANKVESARCALSPSCDTLELGAAERPSSPHDSDFSFSCWFKCRLMVSKPTCFQPGTRYCRNATGYSNISGAEAGRLLPRCCAGCYTVYKRPVIEQRTIEVWRAYLLCSPPERPRCLGSHLTVHLLRNNNKRSYKYDLPHDAEIGLTTRDVLQGS
jgi:hypothetical protein